VSVEVIKIAFLVGAQVAAVRDELEKRSIKGPSWSAIFPGTGKEEASKALMEFHKTNVRYLVSGGSC
jgi:Starter unit:ACP transacylase in aflatoxin biosynthesis